MRWQDYAEDELRQVARTLQELRVELVDRGETPEATAAARSKIFDVELRVLDMIDEAAGANL